MEHRKSFKPIKKVNRTAVERLAVLLFNNVIKEDNIAEMPIIDQANILMKCFPYLLEKKGSETTVSENDVTNIGRVVGQMFMENKRLETEDIESRKQGFNPKTKV